MSRHSKPIANKEIRPMNGTPFPTDLRERITRRAFERYQVRGEISGLGKED